MLDLGAVSRRKCGCAYRSERAPSVRSGHELGGYLVERCSLHQAEFDAAARKAETPKGENDDA